MCCVSVLCVVNDVGGESGVCGGGVVRVRRRRVGVCGGFS